MLRRSRVLVLAAGVAGALATGTVAVAQSGSTAPQPNSAAEARLAWAKRHVELVCRPLESQKMFDRATRCYNDVARLMGSSAREAAAPVERADAAPAKPAAAPKPAPVARPAPVRTASAGKPAPVRVATVPARPRIVARPAVAEGSIAPAAAPASNRCSGVSCLRYTLLGVGF